MPPTFARSTRSRSTTTRSGYASAIGWSLFVIILGVTLVQMRLLRRQEIDE